MSRTHLHVCDVARLYGVTTHTVRAWLKAGHLRGHRIGERGHWRIDPADLPIVGGQR